MGYTSRLSAKHGMKLMSDKDPFAEPDDEDRTIIRPNPGGRRAVPTIPQEEYPFGIQPASVSTKPLAPSIDASKTDPNVAGHSNDSPMNRAMTGMNEINEIATILFSLVSRIRNRAQHMDPEKLSRSVIAELREFENCARQTEINSQDIKIARYAICATLDDVVLNTPWGGESIWAQKSMVGTFHKETVGGDRFYDLLARLEKEPAKNINLLEFLYMCLSLGFEGRLRIEHGGADKHFKIRDGLARIILRQRGPREKELSPHWKGIKKPHKILSLWRPLWATSASVAALTTFTFVLLSVLLNQSSDRALLQMSGLNSGQVAELFRRAPPPIPVPPPIEQIEIIKGFLQEEIADGIVEIFQDHATITVRLAGSGMFNSGSNTLKPTFESPLQKVADALDAMLGQIIIIGHSDNVPMRSGRFASNEALSLARAEAVTRTLANFIQKNDRLSSEGRGDKKPIADNNTREGRAKNRRIEVVLVKESSL